MVATILRLRDPARQIAARSKGRVALLRMTVLLRVLLRCKEVTNTSIADCR